MTAANLHLRWAELLIDGLVAAGVREVVISPGSRSTPLVLAAARQPALRHTVIIDERVAAFFALGQARVTGKPSVLICTSGTAGAHYLPAVIEAAEANVPLIAVTADRPPELHHRQAPQTTVQSHLFDGHARAVIDLGPPDGAEAALAGVRAAAALAVARSLDPRPGPVHVNAPFRKPLEPVPPNQDDEALAGVLARLGGSAPARFFAPGRHARSEAVAALASACRAATRGLILCGPGPLAQSEALPAVRALAGRLGYPVLAEAGSQLRFVAAPAEATVGLVEYATPELSPALEPDLVLQLGAPLTSASWNRWLEQRCRAPVWIVAPHGWNDPANRAAGIVAADLAPTLEALVAVLGPGTPADPAWAARWRRVEAAAAAAFAAAEAEELAAGTLSETLAARAVVSALPAGSLLALGNSLAIREVDLACPPGSARVEVLTQRGVNGIDGSIAGAAGAASVAGRPVTLLTGDLAFQHDLGGLASAARAISPLAIVVLANRGGRLFEMLPIAKGVVGEEALSELFLTPQRLEVEAASRAFGVATRRVTGGPELGAAVETACGRGGATVIEAVTSGPSPRARREALRARLREAAATWEV